jgi:hypothetical protein
MSLLERLLFIICIALTSAQSVRSGQNVYSFPHAQILATQRKVVNYDHQLRVMVNNGENRAIKYVFLKSEMLQTGDPTSMDGASVELPYLPLGDWNEAHIHLDRDTGTHYISNTTRANHVEMMDDWHPRKIDYLEFIKIETLQQDRLQVVAHPEFNSPVLIKIASFPWEIPSLEQEAMVYRLLHGSQATPEFLGHVTEGSRVIGFIIEYIEEVPSIRAKYILGCLDALRSLHRRGIAHGDAHDGNCMIRENGSPALIDFELSVETWLQEEFERDLDIMDRCIQASSEQS